MSRQPKVSKKSKIARRRGRRPDGTFRKGVNGRRLSKPSPEDLTGSLSDMILGEVSLKRLARSVISAAYHGDRAALEQVVRVIEFDRQKTIRAGESDFKHLTTAQLELFESLLSLTKGIYISERVVLEQSQAVIQELSPAPEVEPEQVEVESEITDDDVEQFLDNTTSVVTPGETPESRREAMGCDPRYDPDRIENREYQRKLKEQQEWERLYGRQESDGGPISLTKVYRPM